MPHNQGMAQNKAHSTDQEARDTIAQMLTDWDKAHYHSDGEKYSPNPERFPHCPECQRSGMFTAYDENGEAYATAYDTGIKA